MVRKSRRHFSGAEKVAILKRHLVDRVAVSDLCDEYHLQPTLLYRWQKELFERGASVLDGCGNGRKPKESAKIARLEEKLQKKNEVLSELMEEHVALKKTLGVI